MKNLDLNIYLFIIRKMRDDIIIMEQACLSVLCNNK